MLMYIYASLDYCLWNLALNSTDSNSVINISDVIRNRGNNKLIRI